MASTSPHSMISTMQSIEESIKQAAVKGAGVNISLTDGIKSANRIQDLLANG